MVVAVSLEELVVLVLEEGMELEVGMKLEVEALMESAGVEEEELELGA